jgi:DNA polymerase-3 subunit delta'
MVERLSAVRGQERAILLLGRYLASGKVPAGLLLFGEEGTGKEKAAMAFLAALFCRNRPQPQEEACGECADCRLLAAGGHPNLLRAAPENHFIRIEEIRRLKEELSLKSFSDRPRVTIIVPADRMTLQAANALLKILEEPPPATHFLLVGHRLSQIPSTIVSRCQKIPFCALPPKEVEAILSALPAVAKRHSPEEIRAAAACAGGSPGRAIRLLSESEEERRIWIALFSRPDPPAVLAAGEAWKKGGERQETAIVPLSLIRDLALLSSGGKADIMNGDLEDALRAAAARKSPGEWTRAFGTLQTVFRLPPQAQKRLAMEAFLFDL